MKIYIRSGVRPDDSGDYIFDFTLNLPDDIIRIQPPQIFRSSVRNHIYWFGYLFEDSASSKQRSDFIHYIKGLTDKKIPDHTLTQFIELPLGEVHKMVGMYNIDSIVYPTSGRSKLVNKIIDVIDGYSSRDMKNCSYELVKSAPVDIEFDFDALERDTADDPNKYEQMRNYAETVIMPAIKKLDYFSLAQNVKPKYRKYIRNFLSFADQSAIERYSRLKGENILVVDDINTSGATLNEILRILDKVNSGCNIFVFTLIGNFR